MWIFRHHILLPILLLAGAEALALVLAPLVVVALLPVPYVPTPRVAFVVEILVFTVVSGLGFTAMGLYSRRQRTRLLGVLVRIGASLFAGVAAVALVSYLAPGLAIPRSVLGYGALVGFVAVAALRVAFDLATKDDVFKRRVLIYGAGRRALGVSQLRRRTDTRGFHIVGFVRLDDERTLVAPERVVEVDAQLLAYCQAQEVHEIVIAMDDRRRAFPVHELLECRLNGIDVIDIVDFLERETGRVRLDVLNPSWIIFSRGFDRSRWRGLTKRLFDVVASLLLLAVAWPFMLLTALAIKLEDGPGAPVFYRQRRVGLDSRTFDVFKFRSMRVDAERHGDAVWARPGDSRVTRVGALIRKVRIDELPQIMNVLYGDMSFVGPRPERPEFVSELENRIPYYRERHCVKPGITGWAQLCYPYGASEEDSAEKLQYDLYYVKNHSMLFDLMILLQTAEVVLWGQGAR